MTTRKRRYRRRSSNGTRFSDEYLCALTRGLYVPPSRDTRPKHSETDGPDDGFEETYPRYPFAPLVRMVLKLAKRLIVRTPDKSPNTGAAVTVTEDGGAEE